MRILMAVPKYPFPVVGGLERQAHELAKALSQRGHLIYAVSSRFDAGQRDTDLIDGIRVHRVRWVEFKPARFLLSAFSLARILLRLKQDVDLVHVHNLSWFGAFVTLIAKALGLPVITKLPNIGVIGGIPGMRRAPLGSLCVALLKKSDAIIAMTPESVAELADIRYPMERVLRVTNGIPLLPPLQHTALARKSKTLQAVFVGRLSPEKGLADLLVAWVTVKRCATRPVKLRLIGQGPQESELRAMASALDLDDTVEFCGYCRDVPGELARSDLFVLSSYAEGNSNAILEAMRAALPVVATRVGGAPVQVGIEGDHFLVAPGDRRALADRMLELIEDRSWRLRLGNAMRARIESVFDIERVAETYEHAYELMLSGHREQVGQVNISLFNQLGRESKDMACAG